MRKLVFLIIFTTTLSFSQSEKHIDSLVGWSYEKLLLEFDKHANNSNDKALIYSNAYLNKAKIDQDTIRIANAFTQIVTISDINTALNYCDSIINYTIKNPSFDYPGWGYLYKGMIYFSLGNFEKALKNSSSAYKLALINNNEEHLFYLNEEIGQLKVFWGDSEDAINIYRNQLDIINQNKESFSVLNKLSSLYSLTNAFILQKKLDSASYYNNIGLKLSFISSNEYYPYFLGQSGEILFYQNNFNQAKDSLLKSLKIDVAELKSANTYNILGQIAFQSKDTVQALNFFLKADKIFDDTQDFTPESKNIYTFLKDYYLVKRDYKNSKVYSDKLKRTDSIIIENYKLVNRRLIEDFEIPKLILEKNDALDIVDDEPVFSYYKNKVIVLITTVLVISAFVYIQRKRLFIKKEEELLIEEKEGNPLEDPLKDMNPELVNKILNQLDNFEKRKTFTNKKYNLKSIARKFQTNSSYLSKVINVKKGKNVSTYLSDLRINHCVKELKTNKTYHNYDVKSLATEFGFNNAGSFSKAFSNKTGFTPAAYIKKSK